MFREDSPATSQQRQGDAVGQQSDQGEAQHRAGLTLAGSKQPAHALDGQVGAHDSSTTALTRAARISARCSPKVRLEVGGSEATYDADSATPTAAASVTMWPASASRASEPETSAPTTSTTTTSSVTSEHDPQPRAVLGAAPRVVGGSRRRRNHACVPGPWTPA